MRGNVIVNFSGHTTPHSELLLLGDSLYEVIIPYHINTRALVKPQMAHAIEMATSSAGIGPEGWYGIVPPSHPPGAFALGEILAGRVPLLCGRGTKDGSWKIQNVEGQNDETA